MKKIIIILIVILLVGGIWFLSNNDQPKTLTDDNGDNTNNQNLKEISAFEVALHNTTEDCWTIISNNVYDISSYIPLHPGGDEILRACGNDATSLFTKRRTEDGERVGPGTPHSSAAETQLRELLIGRLADS